jgi:DNA-binding NarL/FixJ family response regulator
VNGAGIGVIVVASSPVVRAGLEAVLARDAGIHVLGSAAPGAAMDDAVARHRPDVLLVEREPGEEDSTELFPAGKEPDTPPLVLMVELEDGAIGAHGIEALRRGAHAVLVRDASPDAIVAAVRAAAAGLVVVETRALEALLSAIPAHTGASAERSEGPLPALTPRELEVLAMLAEGVGNKQIAARLAISEHTVKFHLASIYAKLRVSTRTEAVMAGARRGMVML